MKIYYFYLSKLLNLATGVLLLWWGFLFGLFVGVVLFFFFNSCFFFFNSSMFLSKNLYFLLKC